MELAISGNKTQVLEMLTSFIGFLFQKTVVSTTVHKTAACFTVSRNSKNCFVKNHMLKCWNAQKYGETRIEAPKHSIFKSLCCMPYGGCYYHCIIMFFPSIFVANYAININGAIVLNVLIYNHGKVCIVHFLITGFCS